jgi:hypothetical protein
MEGGRFGGLGAMRAKTLETGKAMRVAFLCAWVILGEKKKALRVG